MDSRDERVRRILRGYDRNVSRQTLHRMIVSAYSVTENDAVRRELAASAIHGPHDEAVMRSAVRRALEQLGSHT